MRRVLTTVLAVALLLGLGALAVLALPGGGAPLAGAPAVSAAAPEFQDAPEAVLATDKLNMIGMPLNSQNSFTSAGHTWDAEGLANYVGSSVTQVLRWWRDGQAYDSWDPAIDDGYVNGTYTTTAFPMAVGGAFWLQVNSTAPTIVSFVGDVPAQGSIKFTWKGTSPACSYNEFTIPLEQSTLADAEVLSNSINATAVSQTLQWNKDLQDFDSWDPTSNDGYVNGVYTTTPFSTRIGYPYVVCLGSASDGVTWP